MHPEIHELGQTFTRFIEARIAGQGQALRDEWEPKLVGCLAGLADDCLAELKAGLAAGEAPPAWLAGGAPPALETRLAQAKGLLLAMVREQTEELGRIITIEGLAGRMPRLDLDMDQESTWADRLAGGKALEESLRKGLAEFRRRVAQRLDRPTAEALASLEADAGWWRVRLKAAAVTILHGVFNRTQRAVLEA
jgi:hypothetical protein